MKFYDAKNNIKIFNNMKMKIVAALLVIACFSVKNNLIFAQEKPEDITGHFFELFQAKGSDAAFDYAWSTNKWLITDTVSTHEKKEQFKKGIALLGPYFGNELIEKVNLTESYVLFNYLLRFDRQPLKITFILYKPNQKWQILEMKFDVKLGDDIESRVK
jgi:hypothetical protein